MIYCVQISSQASKQATLELVLVLLKTDLFITQSPPAFEATATITAITNAEGYMLSKQGYAR
jgi:hypothetical protein